jgi:hypothetical protein
VHENTNIQEVHLGIFDINGQEINRIPTAFKKGLNEVIYTHGYNQVGTYIYSLVIDGVVVDSRRMIFAN